MTTTTAPAPVATETVAIDVRDFSTHTTDPRRETWTAGKMRHVVNALKGAPVVLTTDRHSGHTRVGVVLEGIAPNRGGQGYGVQARDQFGVTLYPLDRIGAVIAPLSSSTAKWDALRAEGDERSAAVSAARADAPDTGEMSVPLRWEATSGAHEVYVRAVPAADARRFPEVIWDVRYAVSDLA